MSHTFIGSFGDEKRVYFAPFFYQTVYWLLWQVKQNLWLLYTNALNIKRCTVLLSCFDNTCQSTKYNCHIAQPESDNVNDEYTYVKITNSHDAIEKHLVVLLAPLIVKKSTSRRPIIMPAIQKLCQNNHNASHRHNRKKN